MSVVSRTNFIIKIPRIPPRESESESDPFLNIILILVIVGIILYLLTSPIFKNPWIPQLFSSGGGNETVSVPVITNPLLAGGSGSGCAIDSNYAKYIAIKTLRQLFDCERVVITRFTREDVVRSKWSCGVVYRVSAKCTTCDNKSYSVQVIVDAGSGKINHIVKYYKSRCSKPVSLNKTTVLEKVKNLLSKLGYKLGSDVEVVVVKVRSTYKPYGKCTVYSIGLRIKGYGLNTPDVYGIASFYVVISPCGEIMEIHIPSMILSAYSKGLFKKPDTIINEKSAILIAREYATSNWSLKNISVEGDPVLVWCITDSDEDNVVDEPVFTWRVKITGIKTTYIETIKYTLTIYIDAATGDIVYVKESMMYI